MSNSDLNLPEFPYRFDLLLEIIKRFAHPARQVVHQNSLWRVTQGQLVSYTLLDNHIQINTPFQRHEEQLIRTSRHIIGMENNLTGFYDYAKQHSELWAVIKPLVGLPIFCTETIFEALITLIIEQHITWKNALRYQQTLMTIFNTDQSHEDIKVYDFPTPQQLSQATQEQLLPLKITHKRIDLIIKIAQDVVNGDLDLESLRAANAETTYKTLLKIKGIGHWTAGNVIGRALGQFPYISHNDVALQAAILYYFHGDEGKKSAQQVIDTLEPFGHYAGLVGHFTLLRWVLDRYPVSNQ
jgi:DNA-3-methyladenine glycosylase II